MAQSSPKIYPIADLSRVHHSLKVRAGAGRPGAGWINSVAAVATGEKRCPKAGEWYLSGAIVEAYCAPNDLSSAHVIAELVLVDRRQVVEIVGYASEV